MLGRERDEDPSDIMTLRHNAHHVARVDIPLAERRLPVPTCADDLLGVEPLLGQQDAWLRILDLGPRDDGTPGDIGHRLKGLPTSDGNPVPTKQSNADSYKLER